MAQSYFSKLIFICIVCWSILTNAQQSELSTWANQGSVSASNYLSEIPFRYIDNYIFIDIIHKGTTYNFLFDTGAEATVISNTIIDNFKTTPYIETNITGPVIQNQKLKTLVIDTITVGTIKFNSIGAIAMELKFAKTKFCNTVHGIIGSTLMKKSKWQIDYKNKVIRLTDTISKLRVPETATMLTLKLSAKKWGTETIAVNIDGYESDFNFDTGNGRAAFVSNPKLHKKNLKKYKKDRVAYGFKNSKNDEYRIRVSAMDIGELHIENQLVTLEHSVGNRQLMGNLFLENYTVTIDWESHKVYLDPSKIEIKKDIVHHELEFAPNFETNQLELKSGKRAFTTAHQITSTAIVVLVNDYNLSNLTQIAFCDFWHTRWRDIYNKQEIHMVLEQDGKTKEIVLTKS
ncbi:retropepsin-like aspartic protease [Aquimarina sp. W85]|uniref:retropepsin-like aspartic protease n=1 Tax=Aquimarina rhodophyticola TaxID=3342246 RepID=UPI00366C1D0C